MTGVVPSVHAIVQRPDMPTVGGGLKGLPRRRIHKGWSACSPVTDGFFAGLGTLR